MAAVLGAVILDQVLGLAVLRVGGFFLYHFGDEVDDVLLGMRAGGQLKSHEALHRHDDV